MKKELWYAVKRDGRGNIFVSLPVRNEQFGIWEGEMIGCFASLVDFFVSEGLVLPIISYNNEPKRLTLSLDL